MDNNQSVIMWQWSCNQLGIHENASREEIKKSFREKAKRLHPDVNKNGDNHMEYLYVKNAYEYLMSHEKPVVNNIIMNQRPSRVVGMDKELSKQFQRQKDAEKSRQKAKNWKPREQFKDGTKQEKRVTAPTEEEILNQIRAILIAEHIKRQIASDKEKKLYKAFMQHEILEQNEKGNQWE